MSDSEDDDDGDCHGYNNNNNNRDSATTRIINKTIIIYNVFHKILDFLLIFTCIPGLSIPLVLNLCSLVTF